MGKFVRLLIFYFILVFKKRKKSPLRLPARYLFIAFRKEKKQKQKNACLVGEKGELVGQ